MEFWRKMQLKRFNNGMVLPTVLVMIIILSLLIFSFVVRFNVRAKGNYGDYISHNKYHGAAHAGINKAEFNLKDVDGSHGGKHQWQDNYYSSFTIAMDGGTLEVQIKDKKKNP